MITPDTHDSRLPQSPDPAFAALLDLSCYSCQRYSSNTGMKNWLEERKSLYPNEKPTLDALQTQCTRCEEGGKKYADSIQGRFSCLYRM